MSTHKRFHYDSLGDIRKECDTLDIELPFSEDFSILKEPYRLGEKTIPNRLAAHPMEGCDGTSDGSPDELVFRRYKRFAEGGFGLLWFEATAVVPEGRANPRQLCLTPKNAGEFRLLLDETTAAAVNRFGEDHRPYTVLQLTHSGRYSRPVDVPQPIIASRNPYLDRCELDDIYHIITDDELEALEDRFVEAALLAGELGFDAVDIKSCHRYLNSELLSAFTRDGRYGGSFENRTRFLLNIIDKINAAPHHPEVTLRLNVYDAIPHPYGWGVDAEDAHSSDLSEPLKLMRLLESKGVRLINITAGNPYYNPHVNRPYDIGPYVPLEHPLKSVERMIAFAHEVQKTVPSMAVVSTGLSWLREYGAHCAAGGIQEGWFTCAGFGRQIFAYPDFPADLFERGEMDRKKCCIACGKCSEIMSFGGRSGCVVRDSEIYMPLYREVSKGKPSIVGRHIAEHV